LTKDVFLTDVRMFVAKLACGVLCACFVSFIRVNCGRAGVVPWFFARQQMLSKPVPE
jgi:hypothetical protein